MANTSFTDLLGSLLNTGFSPTTTDRLKEALGGGGPASGADKTALDFVMAEMSRPMETEPIVAAAQGNPQLGAELYGASLLAIKVDTPAEQSYMQNLAAGLGLPTQAVTNLEKSMGLVN